MICKGIHTAYEISTLEFGILQLGELAFFFYLFNSLHLNSMGCKAVTPQPVSRSRGINTYMQVMRGWSS